MNKNVGYAIALLLALAAPFYGYPVFLMKLLCFALFACAFNLLIGYTGLLSFGHAAFFGGAGYVTGYALRTWGWPTELGLLAGVATGALLGLIMGGLAIRRQGIYFTMITLALAQMLYFLALRPPLQAHLKRFANESERGFFVQATETIWSPSARWTPAGRPPETGYTAESRSRRRGSVRS